MDCACRNCSKIYDPNKSRADWSGYCSQACVHAKARQLGWRKDQLTILPGFSNPRPRTEYHVLAGAGEIGNVAVKRTGGKVLDGRGEMDG